MAPVEKRKHGATRVAHENSTDRMASALGAIARRAAPLPGPVQEKPRESPPASLPARKRRIMPYFAL